MMYFLIAVLLVLFIINLIINNKCFVAPAVVYALSFLFSSLWAGAYSGKWLLDIKFNTLAIVAGSISVFGIVCLSIRSFNSKRLPDYSNTNNANFIPVRKFNINLFLIFEILFVIVYQRFIITHTGASSLQAAIGLAYTNVSDLGIPLYLRLLSALIQGCGYWFAFNIAYNLINGHKLIVQYVIALVLSVLTSISTGSRGTAVCILVSLPAYIFLLIYRNNKFRSNIKLKYVVFIALASFVLLWSFPRINMLIGRTGRAVKTTPMDSLATYIGAEIYNLDNFLNRNSIPVKGTWGGLCFNSLIHTFSKYLGNSQAVTTVNQYPFNFHNGYYLGNVLSMLYEPLHDFGYVGALLLIALYAVIMQSNFDFASNGKITETKIPFSILLFGYFFPILLFSFFAWWFGTYVISTSFIYILISWLFCNTFFLRTNFIIAKRLRISERL